MAPKNDFFENYFEYGIDPRRRRVFLYGDIDEDSISIFIMALVVLDSSSTDKPIEIWMSSVGGDEYEMLAAYDVIRGCKSEVHAIAVGKVMSAAPLILAAADKAKCYPSTRYMVHEGSAALEDNSANIRSTVKEYENLTKIWADRMSRRTNLSVKQWLNLCRNKPDYYFDAEKAVTYGLIDEIIEIE